MNTKILQKLGKRLKELRLEKGFTQQTLAEKVNIHPTYVGKYESGQINLPTMTIYKISRVLKIEMFEIFKF